MLLLNERVQRVELLRPERSLRVQPPSRGAERRLRQPAVRDAPFLHAHDEAGLLEHFQVLRDRRRRHIERFAEIAHRTDAR